MIGKGQAATLRLDISKTVAFSGHRKLPTGDELLQLKARLDTELDKALSDGYDTYLFGGAYGFDLLVAEHIIRRKRIRKMEIQDGKLVQVDKAPQMRLIAVLPFEEQAVKWSETDRIKYYDETLPFCDEVITLSVRYHKDCYQDRNKWMITHSSRLICYYDNGQISGTGQTFRMAERNGHAIFNIYHPN